VIRKLAKHTNFFTLQGIPSADSMYEAMTTAVWPQPSPLEGVKSSKRVISEASGGDISVDGVVHKIDKLSLCLKSRVAAIGAAGRAVVDLLLCDMQSRPGLKRHDGLKTVRLGPDCLGPGLEKALQTRPQVVVLDEALGCTEEDWNEAFAALLCSEGLRSFKGAVLLCVADETRALASTVTESWVAIGSCLRQESYLEVVQHDFGTGSNWQACPLLQEASEIDTLKFWIDDAKKKCHKVSLFVSCDDVCKKRLRGFVCHHMKPNQAEFHVRFIFVPSDHRGSGFGRRLVQWIIASASRMPQSACNWISLDAAYEALVPWYESFGFTDMTCGADEYGQIWMERRNVSVVEEIKSPDFSGSESDEAS